MQLFLPWCLRYEYYYYYYYDYYCASSPFFVCIVSAFLSLLMSHELVRSFFLFLQMRHHRP